MLGTSNDSPVCVIGGGPAGLVAARQLRLHGIPYDQFERHRDVGGIWDPDNPGSPMYRTAHLISSRFTSSCYGYPMPADYPDYPSWRQVLDYFRSFAEFFDLRRHIRFGVEVRWVERGLDGWHVTLDDGRTLVYRAVICATGMTWVPNLPSYPGDFTGRTMHSVDYRDDRIFRGRRVLVVGGGNSGVDIACDAATTADRTLWSVRRGYRVIPKHLFGIPTDAFLERGAPLPPGITLPPDPNAILDGLVGDLSRFGLPAPDHPVLTSNPILNDRIPHHLRHGDVIGKPDIAELDGDTVVFADGSRETVDLVLYATGYRTVLPYLADAALDWVDGHPDLYLRVFPRHTDDLYLLGYVEFADAAYRRFDEMAQLVAMDLLLPPAGRDELRKRRAEHQVDLRAGVPYLDSPRHVPYVETHTFQQALADLRTAFGWPALTDESFAEIARRPGV
ncbi:Predicted flavoprotein CzcO associated with the cation diffusion facilitator CzcD [Streptoalloteichus hindustanus]|uniref:Predicted flavoprotein CzcO associated with the cation diffusion facilitator CzcD n=2 Tax=Streptoalloteichus hindustanus TaxID=2017 RepID=A0A1M5EY17_STRHI|nr:Predicted flavoprotein CzcO associated with the cation diffusion facilitator CzcD [Streptoalloteichus hindustanus]